MKQLLLGLLAIGGLLLSTLAVPIDAPEPGGGPPDLDIHDPDYKEKAGKYNKKHCSVFGPPKRDVSVQQCQGFCGKAVEEKAKEGEVSSVMCLRSNPRARKYIGTLTKATRRFRRGTARATTL